MLLFCAIINKWRGETVYHIIHVISALIRKFLLPNPFSNFFSNQAYADLFNIVIGGAILNIMAYIMTGIK